MASPNDVMSILKGVSAKVNDDTLMILAFMYHVELDPSDPEGKRKNRSKSQYRYEGRIVKVDTLKEEIQAMKANPDAPWRWPSLPDWRTSYDNEPNNKRGAKWLEARIKKAVDWPTFEKLLNGWKPSSNDYKDSRKYEVQGYTCNNSPLDITLDSIKALAPNTTFTKVLTPKRA